MGLYHYKAWAYSPTLGRFLQTDPIGYGDGLNWYAYVGNDPINGSDPTGNADLRNMITKAWSDVRSAVPMIAKFGLDDLGATTNSINQVQAGKGSLMDYVSVLGVVPIVKIESVIANTVVKLGDEALVARGGADITAESIAKGTGTHSSGITGFSVQSANGASLCSLCENIAHGKVGVTTVGDVRAAGGDVITTSGRGQHATVTGLTPEAAAKLLSPSVVKPVLD